MGKDLINAAAVRAQITQINQYNVAVHTFQAKYNCLPGDCPNAATFGFPASGTLEGQGDGNGILEANSYGTVSGSGQFIGEIGAFWVNLSEASLIAGVFNTAGPTTNPPGTVTLTSTPNIGAYLPQAKLAGGNYIYVFSYSGINWYGLSAAISSTNGFTSNPGLTVQQAFSIDTKTDDGLPETGGVIAGYVSSYPQWVGYGGNFNGPDYSSPASGSSTTCFDNGGSAGTPMSYSMAQNGGTGVNCALSFQFQ